MGYMELRTEFSEPVIVELPPVVRYNCVGYTEPIDDGLQHEVFHLLFGDLSQWFGFHPLCEVLHSNHEKFPLPTRRGKWSEYVHPPLGKRPRRGDESEMS